VGEALSLGERGLLRPLDREFGAAKVGACLDQELSVNYD